MTWMIYGANGYTGTLLAEEAVRRGHRPVLAGRSADKIRPLAERLGLPVVEASLDDPAKLRAVVGDVGLVLHAAGPFAATSAAMLDACLDTRASYVDVSGEVGVLEHTLSLDARAQARGVALVSAVGFDVVPTDCLARYLVERMPDATALEIAIDLGASPSPGTARATVAQLALGPQLREGGALRPIGKTPLRKRVRFAHGTRRVVPVSWGDLATAYRTTGVANIMTYMALPRGAGWLARMMPLVQRALARPRWRRFAERWIDRHVRGPDAKQRARRRSHAWVRARNAAGDSVEAWLETLEGYQFTLEAAVRAVEQLRATRPVGALTPARAFGTDFVLSIPTTRRIDALDQRSV
jgi:short subunit dehydrogenase-like uncharacterized protein